MEDLDPRMHLDYNHKREYSCDTSYDGFLAALMFKYQQRIQNPIIRLEIKDDQIQITKVKGARMNQMQSVESFLFDMRNKQVLYSERPIDLKYKSKENILYSYVENQINILQLVKAEGRFANFFQRFQKIGQRIFERQIKRFNSINKENELQKLIDLDLTKFDYSSNEQ